MGTLTINNTNCKQISQINYGALYNWYAATDVRNIAASGWHLSTHNEWWWIATYLTGQTVGQNVTGLGPKLKEIGTTYWDSPNTGATNEVGFNGRGSGMRDPNTGQFSNLNGVGYNIANSNGSVILWYYGDGAWTFGSVLQKQGASIRLVKNSTTLSHGQSSTYIGNDGKKYRTICINGLEWLADNLAETKYSNGDWIHGYDGGVYTPISNSTWAALTTEAMCYYSDNEANG